MKMSLSHAAELLDGNLQGADVEFAAVSTDTRSLSGGELFVALVGERFDGHDYLQTAAKQGAVAALVSRDLTSELPLLKVADTLLGLGQLASAWRRELNPTLVALTGSNGKTTLKEMLAAILQQSGPVLATRGNLNNDIGVPLTLLRLQDEPMAVIEMGANHVGEIDYLSRLAEPDLAILNNAGLAHIGEFGSEENIARGKAEIINGLRPGGTFLFHADSRWVPLWQELAQDIRQRSFGVAASADYRLVEQSYQLQWSERGFVTRFDVADRQRDKTHALTMALAGQHNAMNAVAAFAAASELDVPVSQIAQGLAAMKPVAGRLRPLRGEAGQWLIDDAYNANPDSVNAAIDVLAAADGRRTLVLGDLAELGDAELELHAAIGQQAATQGIERLYSCGQLSQAAGQAFNGEAHHFADRESLLEALQETTGEGDFVLIKGSRSALMDEIVAGLAATTNEEGAPLC